MARGSSERVRVAMIGAGAIGGFFAAKLQEAGHEVTLCVRTPIESLVLEQAGVRREVPVQIVTDPALQEPVAWVFIATKAQDTAGAEPWLQALSNSGTAVVVLQNGIEQAERVKPFAPGSSVVPAVVYCGAERVSPGTIVHTNPAASSSQKERLAPDWRTCFPGQGSRWCRRRTSSPHPGASCWPMWPQTRLQP